MNSSERLAALLDLADPERTDTPEATRQLRVLGLVESVGKSGARLTNAGWGELGEHGRKFRPKD